MSLIKGEPVTVIVPSIEEDVLGEPAYGDPQRLPVGNVVVSPGPTADLDASRPNGVTVDYSLGFPKSFAFGLRGCRVEVRGVEYAVVGDPQRHTPQNTPGDWNLTVEVTRCDG